jgi:hypothetical protein
MHNLPVFYRDVTSHSRYVAKVVRDGHEIDKISGKVRSLNFEIREVH